MNKKTITYILLMFFMSSLFSVRVFAEPNTKQAEEEVTSIVNKRINDFRKVKVLDIKVNENSGTEDNPDDMIGLIKLEWNVKNKAKLTKEILDDYSDDLAVRLLDVKNLDDLVVFWRVPYHDKNNNVIKITYQRNGDKMMIEERWYDPILMEIR